jgi:hypothetical protein
MDHDIEQLKLLSIFHYVVAGLAALFSFFPLLYTTRSALSSYLQRVTEHRNPAKNCRLNFLVGFSLCSAWCCS